MKAESAQASVFEKIYDRHSAVMYGSILRIVKEKRDADKVLRNIFLELPKLLPSEMPETIWFIKHAMQRAFSFLKENNRMDELKQSIKEVTSVAGLSRKPAF